MSEPCLPPTEFPIGPHIPTEPHIRWCATEFAAKLLEVAGPRFAGPIAILRNWTFCLFYVMAELWGSVVVSLLFWGFANQVRSIPQQSALPARASDRASPCPDAHCCCASEAAG